MTHPSLTPRSLDALTFFLRAFFYCLPEADSNQMEKKRLDSAGAAAKPKGKRKAGGDRDKERDATAKKRKEGKETQKQQFDVFDDQVRKNMMVPLNLGGGVVYHLVGAARRQHEYTLLKRGSL